MDDYKGGNLIITAKDNQNIFTKKQRLFWNYFYDGVTDFGPIDKSVINPVNMKELLQYIWMVDLIFDDNQKLVDVKTRLEGTKIVNLYGERTKIKLMSDDGENSYRRKYPESYERLMSSLNLILETKQPVITNTNFVSEEKNYLSSYALIIPVYNNSTNINMVVGMTESLMKTYD